MARRQAPLQVNKFDGGLNTEFNPLSMPVDASIDELNMDFVSDGSRKRRLGFNFESAYAEVDTSVPYSAERTLATSTFKWDNAGGDSEKTLVVVQVANSITIHDMNIDGPLSDAVIYTEVLPSTTYENLFSFAVVDGMLVLVTGDKDVLIYEYNAGVITKSTDTLLIRDLFGVESGDLTEHNNLDKRPDTLTSTHTYNLRNQTFYSPRYANNDETTVDPIEAFYTSSGDTLYPSNADDLNYYLYADPNDSDNRLVERFFSDNMVQSAPSVSESPRGHFIIDALERGNSREEKEAELRSRYSDLVYTVNSLPQDKTPGGATVVEEFNGRIWFGGFSGQLIGGDLKSPRMSSYILFSMLVKDKTDISQCYQRADPTSNEDSALVDTDGGFIRLDGAYGITKMVNLEGSLFVFAANGVWRVSGGEGSSFSATNYQVDKLSNEGTVSRNSIVLVESQIIYWGIKGIYTISRNEYGFWKSTDISSNTIKSFYQAISVEELASADGFYDTYERTVRWVYSSPSEVASHMNELVLNTTTGAYAPNRVDVQANGLPMITGVFESQPYKLVDGEAIVTVDGVYVYSEDTLVTVAIGQREQAARQSFYLVISEYTPTIKYSFGLYRDTTFADWGVAHPSAYLLAGAVTGGEARYNKQAPYLTVFFKRTEDGFDESLNPTNQSSCLVSARWDWTTSNFTKKWSTPREAYRSNLVYIPDSADDTFSTGETVITTRNKIRGMGKSVSFRFEASPGKNLHVHGWAFDLFASGKE